MDTSTAVWVSTAEKIFKIILGETQIFFWKFRVFSAPALYKKTRLFQQIEVYPYPLGAGSARPNSKEGAQDTEKIHRAYGIYSARGGTETMVSDHVLRMGQTIGYGVDPSLLTATTFFCVSFFLFALSNPPFPRQFSSLKSGTSNPLFLVEKKQFAGAGFWGRFWTGSPHREKRRIPFFLRARKGEVVK